MLGNDAHAKDLPALLPQQPVWLQKAPNTSLWHPATVRSTPGKNTSRSYVVSTPDGTKYWRNRVMWQRVIPDEKLAVPPKATSVIVGVPIQVWSPQPSKCNGPKVHTPKALIIIKVFHQIAHQSPPIML